MDTHWARGVSLPEARDQAKSLEREEALLLARALSRSRGESLSREELAAFAESMGEQATAGATASSVFLFSLRCRDYLDGVSWARLRQLVMEAPDCVARTMPGRAASLSLPDVARHSRAVSPMPPAQSPAF